MKKHLFRMFKNAPKKQAKCPEPSPIVKLEQERLQEVKRYGQYTTIRDFTRLVVGDDRQARMNVILDVLQSINLENEGE